MTTNSQLKQLFYIGLACAALVVVVNIVRYFRTSNDDQVTVQLVDEATDQDSVVMTVVAEIPELDHSNRLAHANRIPAVDASKSRFPVQQATLDSIAWDSKVEQVNQIPVSTIDAEKPSKAAIDIRVAELTAADVVNLKPYKPPAEPPAAEFAVSNQAANQSLAAEPRVVYPKPFSGLPTQQNFESFAYASTETEPPIDDPDDSKAESQQPIVNPYVPERLNTRGVYPLTDTLDQRNVDQRNVVIKNDRSSTPSKSVIKNRFFEQNQNQSAIEKPVGDSIESGSSADSSVVNQNAINDVTPELTNLPAFESANLLDSNTPQTQSIPFQPTDNDFVPRVAKATPEPSTLPDQSTLPTPSAGNDSPAVLRGAEQFVLAEQPKLGDHWKDDRPLTDQRAWLMDPIKDDFSPDPIDQMQPYDPYQQMNVYEGKTLNANQRPILELGRPWYQLGQLSPGYSWFGKHNNITPQFLVYGDVRTAVASNTQNGDNVSQIAFEANLDFDLKLTGTERFHMFMSPLDDGRNTRWLLDDDEFVDETDADIDFGYFEGDMGAIVGGFTNRTLPFDMPFAVGVMPLLLQNGVWFEDAFLGVAATIPARSSAKLNISNMDVTFFAGYDKINSDAFAGDDSAARMYGMASFIEAMNGYFEIDYAFLDDRTFADRSYHNFGFGYSRRFGRLLSNSTRVIVNAGQSTDVVENSADGVLLLSENSLITSSPSTLVPYMNFFAGFDRPQSAARAAAAGGVLRNTGILFESDGMTNYPTLDATANDTFGGALGLNLLADDFSQQLIVEMAMLGVMGEATNRNAADSQYGVGFRYQLPLTNAIIFRADGMYGFLEDDHDVRGLRFELRHKY